LFVCCFQSFREREREREKVNVKKRLVFYSVKYEKREGMKEREREAKTSAKS